MLNLLQKLAVTQKHNNNIIVTDNQATIYIQGVKLSTSTALGHGLYEPVGLNQLLIDDYQHPKDFNLNSTKIKILVNCQLSENDLNIILTCRGQSDVRSFLNGACLYLNNGGIQYRGYGVTDGRICAVSHSLDLQDGTLEQCIIGGDFFDIVQKLKPISIKFNVTDGKHVGGLMLFKNGSIDFVAPILDAKYPDLNRVMLDPNQFCENLSIDTKLIKEALKNNKVESSKNMNYFNFNANNVMFIYPKIRNLYKINVGRYWASDFSFSFNVALSIIKKLVIIADKTNNSLLELSACSTTNSASIAVKSTQARIIFMPLRGDVDELSKGQKYDNVYTSGN